MKRPPRSRLVAASALALLAAGLGCAGGATRGAVEASWEHQMRAGAEAAAEGRSADALGFYRQALALALEDGHQPVRLAHAAWYVGDVCFDAPELCAPGEARQQVAQSFTIFSALYGPEHPVVIPILLRRGEIAARDGDPEAAARLVEQADRITARTFPDSHFMRSRAGDHRPASDLDPVELLRILAEVDILGG